MPSLPLEFEVYCATCGAGLCGNCTEGHRHGTPHIKVEPCERCLENARDQGKDDGEDAGYERGYSDGEQAATAREHVGGEADDAV